ncbi:hypothetical protein SE91_09585 [Bradyrhizobium sp. DOA1]|nr:hypothetical protein SE91_09585 [Bradyrhizobium sp. DOA1]
MGFAALYPSYGTERKSMAQPANGFRDPIARASRGQFGAAPPAIDPVVAPHIVLTRKNGTTEFGQRDLPLAPAEVAILIVERRIAQQDRRRRICPQFEQGFARVVFVEHVAEPTRLGDASWVGVPIVHKVQNIHFAGT